MARVIKSLTEAENGEKVIRCSKCREMIAFTSRDLFLDISYGKGCDAQECFMCPDCKTHVHIGIFQSCERM